MLVSELIEKLQDAFDMNGDLPVFINTMDEEGDEIWNEIRKCDACVDFKTLEPSLIRIMDYYD
jgi:hypothetical protein